MILMGWRARLCWLLLAASSVAMPQGFSFGVKGGVPILDALKVTDRSRYFSGRAPYVIGPAVELRLLAGLSAEVNLLYRRFQYTDTIQATPQAAGRTTGQTWEIPMLAKYRAPGELFRPTLSAGFSYRRLARIEQRLAAGGTTAPSSSGEPSKRSTGGATVGGGVELSVPLLRISAELRYTRWGSSSFRSTLTGLASQLNQADFLLGILF